MALSYVSGKKLVDIVLARVHEIDTDGTIANTYNFKTATEASIDPVISSGEENILRVKNEILAVNRTEDIVIGYDLKFLQSEMSEQLLALIDGGDVAYKLETALTGANNDLVFLARGAGYSIKYVVSGNNTPLSVGLAAQKVTVNVETDSGGVALSTAIEVKQAIEASATVSAVLVAQIPAGNDGSGVVTAMAEEDIDIADGYIAPLSGAVVTRKTLLIEIFTADKDTAGEVQGYVKFVFSGGKGTPIKYMAKDNEFFVPEMIIKARPGTGQVPVAITFESALPTA